MLYIKITTLVLLSAFYLVYFGKMLMLKKQNIQGNILGKVEKSKGSYIIEIVLRSVTFLIVPVQFGSAVLDNLIYSLPAFPAMREIGLVFMFVGVMIFLSAIITMRNNWRAGYNREQNTQLVINGIYRFSRNPAFVGFDLLYIGCALAFPNIINIALVLAAVVVFHVQILGEEKFLAEKFGKEYLDYKDKVMRYI